MAPRVTINVAGTYNITVVLGASNGKEIKRTLNTNLPVGSASPEVLFNTGDVRLELGVNGPYQVREVRVEELVSGDYVPADIRYDLGSTAGYTLSGFQRQAVEISGVSNSAADDLNGNGLFDRLRVSVGLNLQNAGTYSYTTSLVDPNGKEIDFISNSGTFSSGIQSLEVTFSGTKIGTNGIDGPYEVRNFLFFGSGGSATLTFVGRTSAFQARQFESFRPARGDTNGDGSVTVADLLYLINFLFAGGQPPATTVGGDANSDGVVRDC